MAAGRSQCNLIILGSCKTHRSPGALCSWLAAPFDAFVRCKHSRQLCPQKKSVSRVYVKWCFCPCLSANIKFPSESVRRLEFCSHKILYFVWRCWSMRPKAPFHATFRRQKRARAKTNTLNWGKTNKCHSALELRQMIKTVEVSTSHKHPWTPQTMQRQASKCEKQTQFVELRTIHV